MASITIRGLEDDLKQRLRPARGPQRPLHGGRGPPPSCAAWNRIDPPKVVRRPAARAAPQPDRRPAGRRILLIIGGGHRGLQIARSHSPAAGTRRHAAVCADRAAQKFITPLAAGALSGERVFTDLFDPTSEFDVGHIRLARDQRYGGGSAGDRRPDGQDG